MVTLGRTTEVEAMVLIGDKPHITTSSGAGTFIASILFSNTSEQVRTSLPTRAVIAALVADKKPIQKASPEFLTSSSIPSS